MSDEAHDSSDQDQESSTVNQATHSPATTRPRSEGDLGRYVPYPMRSRVPAVPKSVFVQAEQAMREYDSSVRGREAILDRTHQQLLAGKRETDQWSNETWRAIGRAGEHALSLNPITQAETSAIIDAAYAARLTGDSKRLESVLASTSESTTQLLRRIGLSGVLADGVADARREYEALMSRVRGTGKPFPDMRDVPGWTGPSDLASLPPRLPSPVTLRSIFERLEHVEDDDRFEEVVEAALLDLDVAVDLSTAPSEDELSMRQALWQLTVTLYPDLTQNQDFMRKKPLIAGSSAVVCYGYLYYFRPELFQAMRTILEMVGLGSIIASAMDRLSGHRSTDQIEDGDPQD